MKNVAKPPNVIRNITINYFFQQINAESKFVLNHQVLCIVDSVFTVNFLTEETGNHVWKQFSCVYEKQRYLQSVTNCFLNHDFKGLQFTYF